MLRLRRRLAAIVITAAALAPLFTLASVATAPVALGADGLQFRTASRYVLVPERAVVRVTVDVTLGNLQPDTVRGTIRTRYYYDRISFAAQDESSHLVATDGGRRLTATKSEQKGFDLVTVRLASNLYYRQTQTFRITYDLPGSKPRSDSDIRVGRAFASFYAWSSGDGGTVRIEIPAGFDVDTYGDDVRTTRSGGRTILTATVNATDRWYVGVYADNPKNLAARELELPNRESIVVRSWPEDRAWADHVSELLTTALPALEDLLGLPWPVLGDLEVSEVHTPTLEGYAGIYDVTNDEIVITEDLDDLVIVHEASHAWFNTRLFDERWANEGLADLYASLALEDAGQEREHAPDASRTAKAAFPLLDWGPPGRIDDEATDAREDYGYDASWQLLERLHTEIGDDGMRAVIRAAEAETIPYVGVGEPERCPATPIGIASSICSRRSVGRRRRPTCSRRGSSSPRSSRRSRRGHRFARRTPRCSTRATGGSRRSWCDRRWRSGTGRPRVSGSPMPRQCSHCGTDWRPRRRPRGSPRRPALRRSTNTRPSRSTRRPRSATRSWTRCMRWWRRRACSRRPRSVHAVGPRRRHAARRRS